MAGRGDPVTLTPPPTLLRALAVFDDATLQALASKGLLRRARRDLEAGKARVEAVEADRVQVAVDGQTVTVDSGGPASADCSCPADGVCRHRLTAVLMLRDQAVASAATAPVRAAALEPQAAPPTEPAARVRAELVELGVAGVQRWAGKAATRAACELLAAAPAPAIETDGTALLVTLSETVPAVRFLAGQGLDGSVSKASAARRKPIHAAAALAVLRQQAPDSFDPAPQPQSQSPDDTGVELPEPGFVQQVKAALADCARTGLSLSPQVLEERLFALAVSSRADALPRLSGLLRTLAAGIDDRRAGRPGFDPRAFLRLAADAAALTAAIERLRPGGRLDARPLLGDLRQTYRPLGDLDLYGCGSQLWRTAAGARGVTAWFYAPALDRWFSAGVARTAGQDGAFDPRASWLRHALWGAGPLAKIDRARIRLSAAAASAGGRLSTTKDSRALIEPWAPAQQGLAWPVCFDDWRALQDQLQQQFSPGLNARVEPLPLLLRPTESARAWFDQLDQRLVWPLRDRNGSWLAATLDQADSEAAAAEVEALSTRPIGLVCALARPAESALRLVPLSYTLNDGAAEWHNLGMEGTGRHSSDPPPKPGLLRRARDQASALLNRPSALRPADTASPTSEVLDDALDALQMWSEVGNGALERIGRAARRLDDAGLALPSAALGRVTAADPRSRPGRVLAAVYLLQLASDLDRQLEWLVQ